jgi:hypothetical protein
LAFRDLNQELAEILALQKPNEGRWCLIKTDNHVFPSTCRHATAAYIAQKIPFCAAKSSTMKATQHKRLTRMPA